MLQLKKRFQKRKEYHLAQKLVNQKLQQIVLQKLHARELGRLHLAGRAVTRRAAREQAVAADVDLDQAGVADRGAGARPEAMIAAINTFEQATFSASAIRANAVRFAKARFQQEMQAYIEKKLATFENERRSVKS